MKCFISLLASACLPVAAPAAVLASVEIPFLPVEDGRYPAAIAAPLPQFVQLPNADTNLSRLELQVVEEMNRARTNPRAYATWLEGMKQYYDGTVLKLPGQPPLRTQEGIRAVDDAIRFLRSQRPLPALRLSLGMSMGSADHIKDIGARGTLGHYGSDGSQFLDRISRYGSSQGAVGENISYGATTAQAIVMQWIVDDGVQGRHHRDNVFFGDFKTAGIACGQHQRYGQMCVATYSGDFSDRIALTPTPAETINPARITGNTTNPPVPPVTATPPQPAVAVRTPPPSSSPAVNNPPPTAEVAPPPPSSSPVILNPPPTPEVAPPPIAEVRIPPPSSSPVILNPSPTAEVAPPPIAEVRIPPPSSSPVVLNPTPTPEVAPQTPPSPNTSAAEVENASNPEVTAAAPSNPAQTSTRTILKEQGSLENGDAVYERDGSLYDVHMFEGRAGQALVITVESREFDTFLAVFDEGDEIVGQNDDISENETNSSLSIVLPRDGTYRIFINGYDAQERGRYTVTAIEQGSESEE